MGGDNQSALMRLINDCGDHVGPDLLECSVMRIDPDLDHVGTGISQVINIRPSSRLGFDFIDQPLNPRSLSGIAIRGRETLQGGQNTRHACQPAASDFVSHAND